MATRRLLKALVHTTLFIAVSLLSGPRAFAGFTPTPAPPTTVPTSTPPAQPTWTPTPGGGDKECMRRVVVYLSGCVPPGAVVSLWNGVDPSNHSSPTGRMRFEEPFFGQPIDSGFLPGVLYHVWLWAPDHPFEFLGEFQTYQCGDTDIHFEYPCEATPTPTLVVTPTPSPVATPTLVETPPSVLPSTGDPTGREGGYALLGVMAFALFALGFQHILKGRKKAL